MSTATYPTVPERSGPLTAGWYAVSGAGIGAYQWSAWWPIEPTEHDILTSQARGRESSKRAAFRAAVSAIERNGMAGRAVEVHKSFANPDKLRYSGSNDDDGSDIHDFTRVMEDHAATKANAKGARAVAEAAGENIPKRSTYRERVDGGAYWIAVMVNQGLGAPPPDFTQYGFKEAPTPPEWYRDPATTQPSSNVAESSLQTALTMLGLLEGATLDNVRKAYRAKVLIVHPDHGGTEAEFIHVTTAYNLALQLMSTR